jgi:MraZ protein
LAFRGIHDHSLDAKNRLTVPSRFRTQLSGPIVLSKGLERCLQVFPEQVFDSIAEAALANVNPLSPQARELDRYLFGNSTPTELDSAGRIMLPEGLPRVRGHHEGRQGDRRRPAAGDLGPRGLAGVRRRADQAGQ